MEKLMTKGEIDITDSLLLTIEFETADLRSKDGFGYLSAFQ